SIRRSDGLPNDRAHPTRTVSAQSLSPPSGASCTKLVPRRRPLPFVYLRLPLRASEHAPTNSTVSHRSNGRKFFGIHTFQRIASDGGSPRYGTSLRASQAAVACRLPGPAYLL